MVHACQVAEEDFNDDQKPDMITFMVTVQGDQPIYGVKALLQFTYEFDVSCISSSHSITCWWHLESSKIVLCITVLYGPV